MRRACGKQIGVVALSQFSSGAHAEVYAALRRLEKQGADAFVFDLRGNGGGLVDEAQLIASAFLPDGRIVTTRGRNVPEKTLDATGNPVIDKDADVAVLVDRGTASASEIVAGALQDRDRATIVGTRTFGKGVFQEVIELSNGGALDITAGQYFTPKGRNLGGQGVSAGTGLQAGRPRRKDDPEDAPRTRRCARRCGPPAAARPSRPGEPPGAPRRAVAGARRPGVPAATAAVPRRARPGRRARSERAVRDPARGARAVPRRRARSSSAAAASPSAARRARRGPGAWRSCGPAAAAASTSLRVLGEPHVARDVIEALMLERGLRRGVPARASTARRARRVEHPRGGRGAARPARPADVHDRPGDRADFDDAISAEDLGGGRTRVWVHIADVSALRAPRRRRRPRGLPARDERLRARARSSRCCRRRCRTRRARSSRAPTGSPSRPSSRSTARETVKATFHRSLIRSDARLDYDRSTASSPGEEQRAGAVGRAAGRGARGGRGALDEARRAAGHALAIESVEPEFAFDRGGHVTDATTTRADRVPPADRAPDDRRQRGGRAAAGRPRRARRSTASTSAPTRWRSTGCWSSSPRSTCRRRPRPSG